MKIVATGHGSPSAMLRAEASDDRPPGHGEVAVDVRAAGINPKDVKLYATEDYARVRDRGTLFPLDLGLEAAGVVTAIGPDAAGPLGPIAVGDEVIAYRIQGAYATRVVVPAAAIVAKPTPLDWAQAASLMLPATTAFHCLAAVVARRGETILVHAAAGTVGRFITQLAIIGGARVVATASRKDFDWLERCGALPVPYGPGLERHVRAAAPTIDAAIDAAGTDEAVDVSLALVPDRRRIATIVNLGRARKDGIQALGGEAGNDEGIRIRENARYVVAALAQAGKLQVQVDRCFSLSEAAAAHEKLLRGGAGRLALIT